MTNKIFNFYDLNKTFFNYCKSIHKEEYIIHLFLGLIFKVITLSK